MNVIHMTKKLRSELQEVAIALQTLDSSYWKSIKVVSHNHAHFKFGVLHYCEEGHCHVGVSIGTHFSEVAAIAQAVVGIDKCFIDPWLQYKDKNGDEAIAAYARDILLDILPPSKAAWFVTKGTAKN